MSDAPGQCGWCLSWDTEFRLGIVRCRHCGSMKTSVGAWHVPTLQQRCSQTPEAKEAEIARMLFETDSRVLAFVRQRAESLARDHESTKAEIRCYLEVGKRREIGPVRWARVVQVAWDRDEGGWRSESLERAARMTKRMPSLLPGTSDSPKDSKGSEE